MAYHLAGDDRWRPWLEKTSEWVRTQAQGRARDDLRPSGSLREYHWMTPPNLQREAQALILYDPVFPADPFAAN